MAENGADTDTDAAEGEAAADSKDVQQPSGTGG
jgi:hypothetical protein